MHVHHTKIYMSKKNLLLSFRSLHLSFNNVHWEQKYGILISNLKKLMNTRARKTNSNQGELALTDIRHISVCLHICASKHAHVSSRSEDMRCLSSTVQLSKICLYIFIWGAWMPQRFHGNQRKLTGVSFQLLLTMWVLEIKLQMSSLGVPLPTESPEQPCQPFLT